MITRNLTKTIEIPYEPGQSITIRKLSHYQLSMAQDAMEDRSMDRFAKIATAAQNIPQTEDERERARAEAQIPENKYDHPSVLRSGIVAWTYPDELNDESVRELDAGTADWAFAEIIDFSVRTPAEKKEFAGDLPPTSGQGTDASPAS